MWINSLQTLKGLLHVVLGTFSLAYLATVRFQFLVNQFLELDLPQEIRSYLAGIPNSID